MIRTAAALLAAVATLAVSTDALGSTLRAPCMEDQPCWSWSTMGNLERGVVLLKPAKVGRAIPGRGRRHRVMDPCQFAYASHSGLINWRKTQPLKGDFFAQKHGCNPYLYG